MKIAYCLKNLETIGGLQKILILKANWLVNHGIDVTFILTDVNVDKFIYCIDGRIKIINLEINYFKQKTRNIISKTYYHFYNKFIHRLRLKNIIDDYDIVISTFGNEMGLLSGMSNKCKKVLEFHGSKDIYDTYVPRNGLRSIIDRYYRQQMFQQIERFDRFIILSEAEKDRWNSNNIAVIPNALFDAQNCNIRNRKLSKKIVAVGRLSEEKDFETLISMFQNIYHRGWQLHIYGDGSLQSKLDGIIQKSKLKDCVFLDGYTSNLDEIYSDAAIYLLTSKYEGFSLATLEACAYKLPIVAFDCGGEVSQLVKDGINGYLIKERNQTQFVQKLNYLIENPEVRLVMGINSEKIVSNYNVDLIMGKWIMLFNELTNAK